MRNKLFNKLCHNIYWFLFCFTNIARKLLFDKFLDIFFNKILGIFLNFIPSFSKFFP
jgi:hypothetical protein